MEATITTFKNATRKDLENYIYDSWGYNDLDDYSVEDLKSLIKDNGEVDLFIGYAA